MNVERKRVRGEKFAEEIVPTYTDDEFCGIFRISRVLFEVLSAKFEASDIYKTLYPVKRLTANKYLLIFLWFAGNSERSLRDIGTRFSLPSIKISSVWEIIYEVTTFINSSTEQIIAWPKDEQKKEISNSFEEKFGISGVIGCIYMTRIEIDQNAYLKKWNYLGRSVGLQAVCNEKGKFIDVFISYPGSLPISSVFNNSPLGQQLETYCGDYCLLAGSAYPSSRNITVYLDNHKDMTKAETDLNMNIMRGLGIIERSLKKLQTRFRQLLDFRHKCVTIAQKCEFINACCVLHNLADENDIDFHVDEYFDSSDD